MPEYKILENKQIAANTYLITLEGSAEKFTRPGQFANFKIAGYFLRRPISICHIESGKDRETADDKLHFIYKILGRGTASLSKIQKGSLDLLTGLGNGFETKKSAGKTALLIGGGVGIPPLFGLAKKLISDGQKVMVLLGFNKKEEIFLADEFEKICPVSIATVDGSFGRQGMVDDLLREALKKEGSDLYIYTCGPLPMLKVIYKILEENNIKGSFSLEERMGCGYGACMGCSIETKAGAKRVCKEGPVFDREDLLWQI